MSEEKISWEQVEKVASLGKLSFSAEEKELIQRDLSNILEYVNMLREIDTNNLEPTYMVLAEKNVYAGDIKKESLSREQVLANATDKDQVYIRSDAAL